MTFPIVQARNESAVATAGTSHAVNLPTGITSGDLLLIIADKGTPAASAWTFNALTGWTELLDENQANGITIWYRVADGTEGSTVTFTSAQSIRSAHVSYRISGTADPGTQAPEISTVATGTSTDPDPGTCTPTGGAKDYLWIAFFGDAGEELDDDTWCNNAPTNYTNLLQKTCGTAGTNLGGIIASAEWTNNAASENPGAFNQDASLAWRAYTIAIHPAPPATAGPALSPLTQPVGGRITVLWPGSAQASIIPLPAEGAQGSATLTGAGSLTADGVITGTATLTGAGVLTASAQVIGTVNGSATLTGAGTLTASASVTAGTGPTFVPLRQPAGLRVIQWRTGHVQFSAGTRPSFSQGSQTLIGAGVLTASGTVTGPTLGSATLTGAGSLTATGVITTTATLTGAGSLSASGSVGGIINGTATLAGAGSVTAAGVIAGSKTLTGVGVLTAAGVISGPASLTGTGVLTAAGVYTAFGTATLTGAGAITPVGFEIPFISYGTASPGDQHTPTASPGDQHTPTAEGA